MFGGKVFCFIFFCEFAAHLLMSVRKMFEWCFFNWLNKCFGGLFVVLQLLGYLMAHTNCVFDVNGFELNYEY